MYSIRCRSAAGLRRVGLSEAEGGDKIPKGSVKVYHNIKIDENRYKVKKNGKVLDLTLREFELLKYLAERSNKVFSREQLLEEVWGYEYYGDIRTVDVTVRRLREKVEDDSASPAYIMTKRGIGYYFKGEE